MSKNSTHLVYPDSKVFYCTLMGNQYGSFQFKKTTDCSKFLQLVLHEDSVVIAIFSSFIVALNNVTLKGAAVHSFNDFIHFVLYSRYVNALDNKNSKLLIFGDICFLLHKNYTNR